LARREPQLADVQRAFDGEADFAAMFRFRGVHGFGDSSQGGGREGPTREPVRYEKMLEDAGNHHEPLAPPPPELPPPPLKPPPPPPPNPPPPNPPPRPPPPHKLIKKNAASVGCVAKKKTTKIKPMKSTNVIHKECGRIRSRAVS